MYVNLVSMVALLMILLGLVMIVVTLAQGTVGVGVLLGVLFVAAGVGRLLMLRRRSG